MAPVDNGLYDELGDRWWDEDAPLHSLRLMVNPARVPYFRAVIEQGLRRDPAGLTVLEVGSGGGLLAEEFARMGCRVTGVDPSAGSVEAAGAHAAAADLDITYVVARGEELPFRDASFDLVLCCDVLEHVDDVERVLAEGARVLRAGGAYLYDTVNRTLLSRLLVIGVIQEWRLTRFMDRGLHDWDMFIRPRELREALHRHGLEGGGQTGMRPAAAPPALLLTMWRHARGRISQADLSRRLAMRRSRLKGVSYMGWAVRRPDVHPRAAG